MSIDTPADLYARGQDHEAAALVDYLGDDWPAIAKALRLTAPAGAIRAAQYFMNHYRNGTMFKPGEMRCDGSVAVLCADSRRGWTKRLLLGAGVYAQGTEAETEVVMACDLPWMMGKPGVTNDKPSSGFSGADIIRLYNPRGLVLWHPQTPEYLRRIVPDWVHAAGHHVLHQIPIARRKVQWPQGKALRMKVEARHEAMSYCARDPAGDSWGIGPLVLKDNLSALIVSDVIHTTPKDPVAWERALRPVVGAGTVILDPCCGVGSTLVAARRLGLQAIGIDVKPIYCTRAWEVLQADRA